MDDLNPPPDHNEQEWMLHARCRSLAPGEFFPSDGVGVDKARRICAQCTVQPECLEYALDVPHRPRRLGRRVRA